LNRVANRRTPARRGPPATRSADSEALVRFRKIVELELRRGCDDGAVIGGMDQFLRGARQDRDIGALVKAAPALTRAYRELAPSARERWLHSLLAAKPAPPKKTPPKPGTDAVGSSEARTRTSKTAVRPTPVSHDPLDADVTAVKGVKGAMQAKLEKLDVRSVRDLLYLFPNRHNDFANIRSIADLQPEEEQTTLVSVWSAAVVRLGRRPGTQAVVGDDTGTMRVVWFNQPYLADQLKTNDRIVLAGKVGIFNRLKTMENPEWERLQADDLTHTGRLVPVYPLTQGLSQRTLRRVAKEAVDRFAPLVTDPLPSDLRRRHGLPELKQALRQMHYPDSMDDHEAARRRVAFEELLCVQLAVLERRLAWQEGRAARFGSSGVLDAYTSSLPFALTGAQERVLEDIAADLKRDRPMARLLQGDVGSGKTAVAAAALFIAAANGHQGALMSPTEILAEQHYKTLRTLMSRLQVDGRRLRVELLTGSQSAATKRAIAEAVAGGEVDVAVGTHALIQEGVSFRRLGLAVVDEQHRFGVMQRAALKERVASTEQGDDSGRPPGNGATTPHLLVMSATPIPRTLALTFFGDLDVSVIDEMPPGRLAVKTSWVSPEDRGGAYAFVREQVRAGRQAFVVCPLIEESAALQTRSAVQEYERLSRDVFPDLRLGLLHGRMRSAEKDAVLDSFRRGELHILVATTVIEVGIDIPNASVMVIEGADRFGLAQLHQLRGRVGRGADQSFCLLLSDDPSEAAQQRLRLLEDNNDGFALAEADLKLRGPGDYFGTRQSGLPEFQAADFSDVKLIETARQEAMGLLEADAGLSDPRHAGLRAAVERMKRVVIGEVS
jgi:ATP-dependent DNA helicase RecG